MSDEFVIGENPGEKCNRVLSDGTRCGATIGCYAEDALEDVSCSCHICPPCSKCCHEDEPYCPECGWEPEPEPLPEKPEYNYNQAMQRVKTLADLDKDSFSYISESTGYYGMIYDGYYPEGWGRSDIESKFNTCFGCKWELFDQKARRFRLKVYTD